MLRRAILAAAAAAVFAGPALAATTHYTARLSGQREVPKTDSKGTGTFDATFDTKTKQLNYTLTFDGLSGPATAAHLHGPAARTETAGVVAPLGDKNPTSPVTGTLTLTDEQAKMLRGGKLYANVHTQANPAGEIRGQVVHASRKKPAAAEPANKS
ncbi:MAG TPA: CHRD domain-containing protein [Rhodopila sp.]|nr:CHRD domain-containing protein [Rhodopila sp.]